MLPDSFSHLHYLQHVFHHAHGVSVARSVLSAQCGSLRLEDAFGVNTL
jgi:hypothetical protein